MNVSTSELKKGTPTKHSEAKPANSKVNCKTKGSKASNAGNAGKAGKANKASEASKASEANIAKHSKA